jgi:actin related protein 2/3 complex subunit 1A/1B
MSSKSKKEKKANASTPLATNIVQHAWNGDFSQVAIAPNTNEVWIFDTNGSNDPSTWTKIHTLDEHDGFVSGIDWHGESNTIVTCAHDRNAYVWEYKNGAWDHGLVILRISRAATSVKWSPDGRKFAVTSGAKAVPVCTFVDKQNWWGAKHIKKGFKSTVIAVDWCVNNKFIVTGATDFKCRIHSAFMANIDPSEDDGFGEVFPKQHEFGECLAEFDQAKAWVNSVAWSPDGFRIAFTGHGGSVHFVQISDMDSVQSIKTDKLPFTSVQFMGDSHVVCGGFDLNPAIYEAKGDPTDPEWAYVGKVDEEKKKKKKENKKRAAFSKFQGMASRGEEKSKSGGVAYKTKHQNTITSIRYLGNGRFTTAGIDGRLLFWDLSQNGQENIAAVAGALE